ncbi:MAG: C-GCAxxG-C-C family (seleno)protein [Spirochaetota bacterium]|nr:C-GCAxxG-C-C family (seleno)protein [Spirochaetota bacterium]
MTTDKKNALMEEAARRCESYRKDGFHCSESSIRAVSEVLSLELPEYMLRVSSGFRGGGGGYGDRCGVLESGILLISFLYGRVDSQTDVSGYSYLIRLLHQRFVEAFGSYYCRVLKPFAFHLSGEEQNCGYVYQNGAAIVMKLLLEAKELIECIPEQEKYGYSTGGEPVKVSYS